MGRLGNDQRAKYDAVFSLVARIDRVAYPPFEMPRGGRTGNGEHGTSAVFEFGKCRVWPSACHFLTRVPLP